MEDGEFDREGVRETCHMWHSRLAKLIIIKWSTL